jgi:hypothetical protein
MLLVYKMSIILTEYGVEIEIPKPKHYIYLITNTISQKQYVGQTKDIKRRIENHLQGKGSKPLLQDLVKQNLSDFKFEVIEQVFDPDVDIDAIEDEFIAEYDCLHPKGYNKRVNRKIVANGQEIDLNSIPIQGKFVFDNEQKVFSIGECSHARSYQILSNIKASTETSAIIKKRLFKFNYFELKVETEKGFVIGEVHELKLRYRFNEDKFILL